MTNKSTNQVSPHVTIVMLNWNQEADTLECLDSLAKIRYPAFSILLVDNGSTDGSAETIERWANKNKLITLIRNKKNKGFIGGSNIGIRRALTTDTNYIFLLNNDTVVEPHVLTELVDVAEQSNDISMVGPKIYQYNKEQVLDSAGTRTMLWLAQGFLTGHGQEDLGQYDQSFEMPYITGTALLIKRSVVERIGLMDEDYFNYFDDFDWGYRARKAGGRLLFVPKAIIQHKGSQAISFGSPFYMRHMIRSRILFARKHIPILPFLFIFLPYLAAYRYLKPALNFLRHRQWDHLQALHTGIQEGFITKLTTKIR
ncbi:MAG: glycosyltransferase family 2 protein [Candidatus Latescibacteria bacterium]|nr:glycosyltransferase family 2 protein [Candidatus Latescibacterota bacterium]